MDKNKRTPNAQQVRESSVGWMLKRLSTSLDVAIGIELKKLGLSPGEFGILMTLLEEEGMTQAGIGKRIAMPGYATTRNIDVLEAKKLVQRRKDEQSRRNYRIFLTEEGRELGGQLFEVIKTINEALLVPLHRSEQTQLVRILHKLLKAQHAIP